jgi:NADH-quinone oxidoreductase subunit N
MKEFVLLMPEIFLAVTLVGIAAAELSYHGERVRLTALTGLVGLAGAFLQTLLTFRHGAAQIFAQSLSIDGLALFFKLFFITLGALGVATALYSREIAAHLRSEYIVLVLGSTLALCVAASASNLLLIFLSLQSVNVLGHFLAAYDKRSIRSTEAAFKQMLFSALAGTLFLYGGSLLFVSTRTLGLYEMHQALAGSGLDRTSALAVFGLVFFALAFQMAAFPMYLWAPDTHEGAPTPAASFIALASRGAGLVVALRFLLVVFAQPSERAGQWEVLGQLDWPRIVAAVSGITMAIGALLATRQTSAKRLISCLLMVQTGFALVGLLVLDESGVGALLYHLIVELFALTGAFYTLSFLLNEIRSDQLPDLRGALSRAAPETIGLIVFLICLIGLPPLPGFIGKFALLGAAVRHQWHFLAWVGILATGLSMVAVARLSFSLVGDLASAAASPIRATGAQRALLLTLLIPMLLLAVFSQQVLAWVGQSLRFIFW